MYLISIFEFYLHFLNSQQLSIDFEIVMNRNDYNGIDEFERFKEHILKLTYKKVTNKVTKEKYNTNCLDGGNF